MTPGSKGQIPYIELNGQEIPDSNVIIETMKEKFGKDPDAGLTEEQKAKGHIVKWEIWTKQHHSDTKSNI